MATSDLDLAPALVRDPNPGILRGTLHALYDVAWIGAALVGLPWLLYRSVRHAAFGDMVLGRLGRGLDEVPVGRRPRMLVHGVSVGEIKAALPLVRAIEAAHPEVEVVVSTTTDTGLEVARQLFRENPVVRFPADLSWVVTRFLDRIDPTLVLLVELEIWPNFLRACNRSGRPVAVVNGRITRTSHGRYLVFRRLLPQFNRISLFCVQLEDYAERFRRLGVDPRRVRVTGNVKVDGLRSGRIDPGEELTRLLGPAGDEPVLVCGSTHAPEELLLARTWRAALPEARLVLVPRHPPRCDELVHTLTTAGFAVQRLTRLRSGAEEPDPRRIAVVDTIGELERVYGLADLVFVGGSLAPRGGQNVLEPAAQGRAVVFGPHMDNFAQEAALLGAAGAVREVADAVELEQVLAELLADGERRSAMGEAGMRAVEAQRGATARTISALDSLARAVPQAEIESAGTLAQRAGGS